MVNIEKIDEMWLPQKILYNNNIVFVGEQIITFRLGSTQNRELSLKCLQRA
jgi:hypothetical protein